MENIDQLIDSITAHIVNPLILLLFAIATLVFFIGIFRYLASSSPEDRSTGTRHMMWGLIGMLIMLSVFGIMHFIAGVWDTFI